MERLQERRGKAPGGTQAGADRDVRHFSRATFASSKSRPVTEKCFAQHAAVTLPRCQRPRTAMCISVLRPKHQEISRSGPRSAGNTRGYISGSSRKFEHGLSRSPSIPRKAARLPGMPPGWNRKVPSSLIPSFGGQIQKRRNPKTFSPDRCRLHRSVRCGAWRCRPRHTPASAQGMPPARSHGSRLGKDRDIDRA